MPVNPLAAAALIAACFAIPFGVAALLDTGPEPKPVAVPQRAVERLDDPGEPVRIATLAPAARLPALRAPVEEPATPAAPETEAGASTAAAAPAVATPVPAAAPAPAPSSGGSSSGGGGSNGGGSGGGSFDSGGGSDSFDSTR